MRELLFDLTISKLEAHCQHEDGLNENNNACPTQMFYIKLCTAVYGQVWAAVSITHKAVAVFFSSTLIVDILALGTLESLMAKNIYQISTLKQQLYVFSARFGTPGSKHSILFFLEDPLKHFKLLGQTSVNSGTAGF